MTGKKTKGSQDITPEKKVEMLEQMIVIRHFEQKVEQMFMQGKIHGTMHLCTGQEATAVGAIGALEAKDKITSTHRGHGHCIAKGSDIGRMLAELLAKETGYCKGKGGSMHIADLDLGNLGANGIVAGGHPLATGAALTSKMKKLGYVVICFFGDGASNEGSFHESLNLAAVWDLPVIFFCENNEYAMSGPIKEMINIEHISQRASSYGMPGVTINGSDVLEVYEATKEAAERARSGQGPTLIEAKTYRFKGHSRADARKYRTREEEKEWITKKDPIALFKKSLIDEGVLSEEKAQAIEDQVQSFVEKAQGFAENSPEPSPESLQEDVYA
ncbi:pyruvate dehydrogenase [Salipaludibacillus keqinensis]|uniref:Pyruvate dehydrogenase n=1 Tax=Salipaludibacillus keqinensis TaxID=2045207 RepID=A0A323TGI8_9BACI|nr:thiamine pyrophosphate-dependent dehydrogenase E1 component subunit alpha [Salipaludibacillus keqinensis]PYZ93004.1 pyruvate dehydrogenase [Salipaludibacillus keqinensis]